MSVPSIRDSEIKNKTVLIRFDGDVPVENGNITDDYRLEAVVPTITYCLEREARVVLLAHRGRPKGKRAPEFSLDILVSYFRDVLGQEVAFYSDIPQNRPTEPVALLENVRFWPGEESNDKAFASSLATLGDIYCNDAFAVSHRAHASVEALAHLLPHVAGFRMEKEIANLSPLRDGADDPYVVVMGGAKVEDKAPIIADIIERCDILAIGGLIAMTYLAATCQPTGAHQVDEAQVKEAQRCIRRMHEEGVELLLPVDYVNQEGKVKPIHELLGEELMLDIGPATNTLFAKAIDRANSLFWNGAMGKFEDKQFAHGTTAVGRAVAASGAESRVASGGDTVAAIHLYKLDKAFTFISTGGGASLEFLAGRELPGIKVLTK